MGLSEAKGPDIRVCRRIVLPQSILRSAGELPCCDSCPQLPSAYDSSGKLQFKFRNRLAGGLSGHFAVTWFRLPICHKKGLMRGKNGFSRAFCHKFALFRGKHSHVSSFCHKRLAFCGNSPFRLTHKQAAIGVHGFAELMPSETVGNYSQSIREAGIEDVMVSICERGIRRVMRQVRSNSCRSGDKP